ncbi:uncharacterized protein [Zea mays]|uniref:Uncharacterized protein n=2 Tax=Zea mays TaxID=4577 RepID=C4J9W2_MAIZE|nr:uncharacterized protein LOC100502279 [Zea mays]XP_008644231.1 uncharacterized protein LOC100502279 isoform X1 [Zea mays]ACR37962.1 unknown [Zea mays]AQK65313.1 hypothetical protein ZEAMMB73_Zm00001d014135 [Zea mays]|eukprot:NP_001183685.1 uncharacterized protein LOC100502279 [Zea mays]
MLAVGAVCCPNAVPRPLHSGHELLPVNPSSPLLISHGGRRELWIHGRRPLGVSSPWLSPLRQTSSTVSFSPTMVAGSLLLHSVPLVQGRSTSGDLLPMAQQADAPASTPSSPLDSTSSSSPIRQQPCSSATRSPLYVNNSNPDPIHVVCVDPICAVPTHDVATPLPSVDVTLRSSLLDEEP